MNQILNKKNYAQSLFKGFEKRTGEPDWLFRIRSNAAERFKAAGFPTRKQEAWRYIYLEGLLQGAWTPVSSGYSIAGPFSGVPFGTVLNEENRLVFMNGIYQESVSRVSKVFHSLLSTRLNDKSEWAKDYLAADTSIEKNPFVSINTSQFDEGVFLRVPQNTVIDTPLHITFTSEGADTIFYPRILVAAEEGAQVNLVFHLCGNHKDRFFMNGVAEFRVGTRAKISCVLRQQEGPDAVQFFNVKTRVQEGGCFEMVNYAAGGSMIRNETDVELLGPHAFVSVSGLSLMSGNSQVFQHVTLNHQVPHGTSRQVYKNILAGKSLAEFNSMVHVWRDAKQSDSEQLDKNLLLSETARVYSRPQLRIDNDDVKASHGAATGQLQEKEVFYLRSRGLDEAQARFLLIYGFAQQVLEKIQIPWLRKELEADMETRIREMLMSGGERVWQ